MKHFISFIVISIIATTLLAYGANGLVQAKHDALQAQIQAFVLDGKTTHQSSLHKDNSVQLLLVGDIMLSRAVGDYIHQSNDPTFPFHFVADAISNADVAFGNLEGPISSRGANQGSEYSFRASPNVVQGLSYAGFDVLSIANNHIWDWGGSALNDTRSLLVEQGIGAVGAGRNQEEASKEVVITPNGVRIAFVASTNLYPESLWAGESSPGVNGFVLERMVQKIQDIRRNDSADIVVVSLHWGQEYEPHPTLYQKEIAHELIDAGADIIAGHHPHVVQDVEQYPSASSGRSGVIFYSLGNFVFDQPFSKETMSSIIAQVQVTKDGIEDIHTIPVTITKEYRPTLEMSND